MLEGRENAENVWYSIVWQEVNYPSNVIDYNINEEKTKDKSSVFNSNNDTTTGMATVIPWVNAPKLIQTTSIYQNWEWINWWVKITGSGFVAYPDDTTDRIRNRTLSNQYGTAQFVNKTDGNTLRNWFQFKSGWWYELYMTYPTCWSSFAIDVKIYIAKWWHWNDILIHSYSGQYNTTQYYWTLKYKFATWDVIYAQYDLRYNGSASSFQANKPITIQITKL